MAKSETTQSVNRRNFLVGTGAATLVVATAAGPFTLPAEAGIALKHSTGPNGLIEIAGKVTDAQGKPHKQAYIEIIYQNADKPALNTNATALLVNGDDGMERFGVWTDDDGTFGLHTWWSNDNETVQVASAAQPQADVLFDIQTQDGNRSQWNVRLEANPNHIDRNPETSSSQTPVKWSDRANAAQFVANFTVD